MGFKLTNLNWWVYRISKPSTVSPGFLAAFQSDGAQWWPFSKSEMTSKKRFALAHLVRVRMFCPQFFFKVHEIQLRPMKGGSLVPETAFSSDTWYLQIRYRTKRIFWRDYLTTVDGSEIGRALLEVGSSNFVYLQDSWHPRWFSRRILHHQQYEQGLRWMYPVFFLGGWTKHQSFGLKIMVFFHLFFFCGSFIRGTLIANLVWAKKRKPLQFSKPQSSTLR